MASHGPRQGRDFGAEAASLVKALDAAVKIGEKPAEPARSGKAGKAGKAGESAAKTEKAEKAEKAGREG